MLLCLARVAGRRLGRAVGADADWALRVPLVTLALAAALALVPLRLR